MSVVDNNTSKPKQNIDIHQEIIKVENYVLNKVCSIKEHSDLLNLYYAHYSIFLPTLEFAVEHMEENSITQLANFGILFDHLSYNQLNRLVENQVKINADYLAKKSGKATSELLKLLNGISSAQKHQIITLSLTFGSIKRDSILYDANSKFNVINKAKLWANIFSHFFSTPILCEQLLSLDILKEAEIELTKIKKLIYDVKERDYDNFFAIKYEKLLNIPANKLIRVPKLFLGTKISWLMAMEGLYFCKFILTKEVEFAERALIYNTKLQKLLLQNRSSKDELPYRNLDTTGPSLDIKTVIDSFFSDQKDLKIIPISSLEWFLEKDGKALIIEIPSNFNFYFSNNITVSFTNSKGEKYQMLAANDIKTIIEFGENPALFVAKHFRNLSPPKNSFLLELEQIRGKTIVKFLNSNSSFLAHLETLYPKSINKKVFNAIKKGSKMGFEAFFAYGIIFSFERIAESQGIEIDSETWNQIRTILSGIVILKIERAFKEEKEETQVENKTEKAQEDFLLSSEEKILKLYEKIEESEKEFNEAVQEINDSGLFKLMSMSNEIKEILLSGQSVEQIKKEIDLKFNISS